MAGRCCLDSPLRGLPPLSKSAIRTSSATKKRGCRMIYKLNWLPLVALLGVFISLNGCGPGTKSVDPSVRLNVVTIDRDGQPRNPVRVNDPPLTAAQFEKHIDELLGAMDEFHS